MDIQTFITLVAIGVMTLFFYGSGVLVFVLTLQNRPVPADIHAFLVGGILWALQNAATFVGHKNTQTPAEPPKEGTPAEPPKEGTPAEPPKEGTP